MTWVTECLAAGGKLQSWRREPARPIDIVMSDATQVTLSPTLLGSGLPKQLRRVNGLFAAVPQFMHN